MYIKTFYRKIVSEKFIGKPFAIATSKTRKPLVRLGLRRQKCRQKSIAIFAPSQWTAVMGFFLFSDADGGNPAPIMSTYIPRRLVGYAMEDA